MHTVIYFASIREQLGLSQEQLDGCFNSLDELRSHLCQRGQKWHQTLSQPSVQVAQNQQLCDWHEPIIANSEIAIFPPMTGG